MHGLPREAGLADEEGRVLTTDTDQAIDCEAREIKWKEASGLHINGDHSAVSPGHLAEYLGYVGEVISAVRMATRKNATWRDVDVLRQKLGEMDAEWPEELDEE